MTELLSGVPVLACRFLERALLEIETLHSLLESAAGDAAPALARVGRVAHSIHGTGAAFGFDVVSESAGALERRVKLHLSSLATRAQQAESLDELHVLVARLDASIIAALVRLKGSPL
jgi:chemotaxis protein histidine kinase CheA